MLLACCSFVDACLSATLSSVMLNAGGAAPFILACLVEGCYIP